MEFTFGDLEKGGELTLGMHMKGKSFGVLTVDRCMIVDEDFRTVLKTTVDYFRSTGLPYYRVMRREGYLRHLVIRKATNTGELMVNLVTTTQVDFDLTEYTELLKSQNYKGKLVSILHTENNSLSDAVVPEKVNVLFGRDYIVETLLGLKFKISPFSFFQTNSKGAESLYSVVRDFMGDGENKVVFDLYCGTGTIGQIAAPNAKKVVGLELIEEAVEAAKENAKLNGLNNCEFIAGDVAETIKKTAFKITRIGQLVAHEAAKRLDTPFGIVDLSLAPTPAVGDSVAHILEAMGLEVVGTHGTTAALALLNDAVKKGGVMACSHVGGLSGAFIPVSEDAGMIDAVLNGSLNLEKLEAMTAICSVGLDMIAVPGDTPAETLSAMIADESAIGVINNKTTAVRIIPAPGCKVGDLVEFGGLLGTAPVMPINKYSSFDFIQRGGRIPAPIHSFKN